MSARLIVAYHTLRVAEQHAEQVLREEYPVGSPVEWCRQGSVHRGAVALHGGMMLLVVNIETGAPLHIHASEVIQAFAARTAADA